MEFNCNNGNQGYCSDVNNYEKSFNDERNYKNALSSQTDVSLCTQQKLELSSWGLPERILKFYHSKGITHMFKWQLECLSLGRVLDAGNLVYSAPTSAGKTLVAEILISKTVFELQKKALVILPFVSVVREKMFYFQDMFASNGIHVEGYMGGHSPSISFKQVHLAVCTIEKANSIINKLMEEQNLQNLGLVVVDELHLLGDPYRGYLLELLLTKLKYISSKSDYNIQIVGMSATLPNLKSLADWLNADLYYTDFRPVPLNEKLKCGNILYDKKLTKLSEFVPMNVDTSDDSESIGQLCVETIANGHSVLIFCPTKIWCENLAEKISLFFRKNGCSKSAETEGTPGWILRKELDLKKINDVIEHLKMSPVGLDKDLHKTVSFGVAFHHAGLTLDERDIIEGSFRKGSIRVLCATSTLSSGVNLPARRVIIRSPMSFGGLMDILTYRQMIGRAGRMGVDSEGESILICKPNEKSMCQTLMSSSLKPIESCLGHGRLSGSLKRALLEIVASGVASTPEEVKKYAACTFLAWSSKHDIEDPIQSCIEFLEENEFIRLQENGTVYVPTPLAKACLASSLPPDEGLALFRELQRARRCFVLDTDLHIIYQVTPYSVSEQWNKVDWLNVLNILEGLPASMKRVGEMVGVEESFLVRIVKGTLNPNSPENRIKLSIHRRFYTSLALQDLVNEMPLSEVAGKYECNKGMLQSLQQSAATYAGMVTEFTKCLGWNSVELIFSQFQERLQFGIQRELCDLMRLPLLNAMRARALFNAGFTSLSAIANASISELENVFFGMAPFQSKKEIAGETTYDKEQRNKLEAIWVTGKADLSVREAAELLITDSRNILETELGLEDVKWGRKSTDTSLLNKTHNSKIGCLASNKLSEENGGESKISPDKPRISDPNLEQNPGTELSIKEPMTVIKTDISICKNSVSNVNLDAVNNSQNMEIDMIENDGEYKELNIPADVQAEKLPESDTELESKNPLENNEEEINSSNKSDLKESEVERRHIAESENNEVDYFASSFNFDMVPASGTALEKAASSNENDRDFVVSESDSNSSVEILYDSTVQFATKNLSFSRLSDDMFEMSRRTNESNKNMSTPIMAHGVKNLAASETSRSRLAETRSPDLFSESLTFDTQMGKILDFEERSADEKPHVINPSSSINSDDLGFVSDLSPPKPRKAPEVEPLDNNEKKNLELQNAGITASFLENGFQTFVDENRESGKVETTKRKVSAVNSPDLILDSSKSEDLHPCKRVKYVAEEDRNGFPSHCSAEENGSDDEIMPTPKNEKTLLSIISKSSRLLNTSVKPNSQSTLRSISQRSKMLLRNRSVKVNSVSETCMSSSTPKNISRTKLPKNSCKFENVKWDKINVIDVSEGEQKFKFFCEQLKEQTIVGLALACRKKTEEKKSAIGMKITKRRKVEGLKETTSKCQHNDIILDGISFYWKDNDVFYMSLDDGDVSLDEKITLLKSLNRREIIFRIFDAKEQIKMLQRCSSLLLTASYQDPKVAFWLLAENWKERNYSSMALDYLPASKTLVSHLGAIVGYSSPGLLARSSTPHKTRACVEAFLTYHMISQQLPLLTGKGLQKAFEMPEMPITLCLAEMELTGFQLCRNRLLNVMEKLDKAKETLEEKAYSLAQQKFSISSAVAVSKILSKVLCLEGDNIKLTKKRKLPSTSKQALQELADETKHPLPEVILQWRKIRSITTKFVSPLLQITTDSSKAFGVSQIFTVTGRISMHEPNLQNIPKGFTVFAEENESVSINLRDVFVASENCRLMSVDYCQIELRMLAHLSQDSDLIRNIRDSSDIFVNIAATVFGVPHYEVDDNLRQRAKQTCYGMIYGIGPRNLAQQLQITEADATELIDNFKNKYQGVKTFLDKTISECRNKGYVTTLFNRRRYIPAINDSNQAIRSEGERQAVNTTIQGSAADLVKTAMVLLREKMSDALANSTIARLVLHLHDELIFEVGKDALEAVAVILKDTMENAVDLTVPTPVKIKVGSSWGQLAHFETSYLPELCPVCSKDLSSEQFKLLPIRIPYPFVRAVQHPCSILIKPTSGDFLNDYFNSVDLHIGVTDSTGAVVEYDKNGLQRRKNNQWNQCLVLDGMDESWADHWDEALKTVMKEGHWTPQRYNETSYNCYTFVLAFLQKLEHGLLSNAAYSSTYFCEKFIIPRTTAAGKYISLYRKLRAVKCYIHGGSEVSLSSYQESVPSR